MEDNLKNYGFDGSQIKIDASHYILGGDTKLSTNIMQADGDWRPFIPKYEPQFTPNYDTFGCSVFGTWNALEVLMKKLYGNDYDYAERFNYILVRVRPPGADPHIVIENIRKSGGVVQALLPMTDTFDQFVQPDPMSPALIDKGLEFLNDKEIGHEWIFTNNPSKEARVAMLKNALTLGTVAISVTAWVKDSNGLYIDLGRSNCHWVCLVALEEIGGEFYPVIIDSYDQIVNGVSTAFIKKLHPDHHIEYAKRYSITPKVTFTKAQKNVILMYINQFLTFIGIAVGLIKDEVDALPITPDVAVPTPPPVVISTPPAPKYLWDTPEQARHSFRVICDEEGLSVPDKNLLSQVLNCESGFKVKTVHPNNDTRKSTDFGVADIDQKIGIAQFNDYWYKDVISPEDALNDPEKASRVFISQFKKGHLKDWVCYSSGLYLKYKS